MINLVLIIACCIISVASLVIEIVRQREIDEIDERIEKAREEFKKKWKN